MWINHVDWDAELPALLSQQWITFQQHLRHLSSVRSPRLIIPSDSIRFQIIAYSAVVYLQVETSDNNIHIFMLKAKTKVAPLNTQTIPRLELCGALLLVRTLKSMTSLLSTIHFERLLLFSDSNVVLSWIKTPPHLLKIFVANRVCEIQSLNLFNKPIIWSYIPSEDNPADCASRGLLPSQIINHDIWWKGSHCLRNTFDAPIVTPDILALVPELKPVPVLSCITNDPRTF